MQKQSFILPYFFPSHPSWRSLHSDKLYHLASEQTLHIHSIIVFFGPSESTLTSSCAIAVLIDTARSNPTSTFLYFLYFLYTTLQNCWKWAWHLRSARPIHHRHRAAHRRLLRPCRRMPFTTITITPVALITAIRSSCSSTMPTLWSIRRSLPQRRIPCSIACSSPRHPLPSPMRKVNTLLKASPPPSLAQFW